VKTQGSEPLIRLTIKGKIREKINKTVNILKIAFDLNIKRIANAIIPSIMISFIAKTSLNYQFFQYIKPHPLYESLHKEIVELL